MSSRALLLLNPGARRGGEGTEEIVRRLKALALDTILEVAADPARVPNQLLRHRGQVDRILVGGGDGTLNLALQTIVETRLPLGILPLGTANNLARTLGIPDDLAEACEVAAHGHRRPI